MTIADFFKRISSRKCPVLNTKPHTSNSVKDFYKNCIEPNMPDVKVVKGWHKLFKKYIDDLEAVFFIRRYASGKDKDNNWDIRRGFLTENNNVKYVFVDNFFAQYFYAMAYNGFVPEYDDFKSFILNRKIPYGYSAVSLELSHQAYKRGAMYPLNKNGWKLSHVFSANQNDYNFDYKKVAKSLFPKGEYSDFKKQAGYTYPLRLIKEDVSDENRKRIKAHFLRVVHPINHFLTPMIKFQESTVGIKDIGEYPGVITFMKNRLYKLYGSVFTEYQDMILAPSEIIEYEKESPIGLHYGMTISKASLPTSTPVIVKPTTRGSKKARISTTTTSQTRSSGYNVYPDNIIANCIRAYLFDGYSFRDIENEILGLEYKVRGGGFIAKKLLESRGINASMKKRFNGQTIKTAIDTAEEPLKSTLKWMDLKL